MGFQKSKNEFYCLGGRHGSATDNTYGDITCNSSKVLIGYRSICNRKKSMTVSDNTITAETLGEFVKNLGNKSAKFIKKDGKKCLKESFTNFGYYSKH